VRSCGGEQPILFFKSENVWATTLLVFLKETHIAERTLVNKQLAFSQLHRAMEHRKITVYGCSVHTL